jgi:hydrogenase-4 component B
MDAIQFIMLSLLLYCCAALVALLGGGGRAARLAAGWVSLLASLAGVVSAAMAFAASDSPTIALLQLPPFGVLALQIDPLSAFFVGLIGLIGAATSLYSMSSPSVSGAVGFFTYSFLAAMLLVVSVNNGFFFLLFWELMTLLSYFLVIWKYQDRESVKTGYLYMLVAHVGAALLLTAFLILYWQTDSFSFRLWHQAWVSPGVKTVVFLLIFVGFGAKAGMAPLHFWAPGTYSAAPDHASALMSAVMKKTAVYGLLRFCVDLLGVSAWWWGFVILLFGVASTVIGAFYALTERDIKRLLAYSSVENVGIILMGVGVGMFGLAVQQPVLATLGLLAALYHLLNHAFFKAMLFLGAGQVIAQTGTQDLNRMGGLARRMPWTALTFLVGALAAAAVPPLNGFVSEWFTYQALFTASAIPFFAMRVFAPLFAVSLALAGALALMVYIKAYGGAFAGPARSQPAAAAQESNSAALFSLFYLSLGCLILGLGAPWVVSWIAGVVSQITHVPAIAVSSGWQVFPADPGQAVFSPLLAALLLIGLLVAPLLIIALYGGFRAGRRSDVEPWACGYGYSSSMSLTASSFDQPVKATFQLLYWLRTRLNKPFQAIAEFSRSTVRQILRAEPAIETIVTRPATRLVESAGQWIQALQMGDIRVYCLYIILTLAVLLFAIFGRSGL